MVKSYAKKVIEDLSDHGEILELGGRQRSGKFMGLLAWAMSLRRGRFDVAFVFPNSFSSALMVFLAGIRRRVGYSREGRGFLLTDTIRPVRDRSKIRPIPMVEYYLRITDTLGCPRVQTKPGLTVSPQARKDAQETFARSGIDPVRTIITVIPGAAYGSSKCWRPEYFAEAADRLVSALDCQVLIIPGPGEIEIAREIERRMQNPPITLVDPVVPLDTLMAIIESSTLVITNDTGPRHFAVAFDRPVVVIIGPTDPRYTNLNLERTIVLREDLDCSPCHLRVCPRDHRCMTAITPDDVVRASEKLIREFVTRSGKRQETEVRSQKTGVRSQKTEVRRQK
jgi:heptosyltransferase-2